MCKAAGHAVGEVKTTDKPARRWKVDAVGGTIRWRLGSDGYVKLQWAGSILGAVTAAAALAADARSADEPAMVLMAVFRKEVGLTFKECTDEKCISVALRSCTPAHATSKISTVEGTPAVFDYFVVKRPQGCRLVRFSDYTRDYWCGCKVRKHVCHDLKASQSDDPERFGCSPNEVLYTAKVCPNPMREP